MFDPKDVLPMIEAFERGKSIVVASHNPLTVDSEGQLKKARPGISAAYLALLTNAPVLPVAISMLPTEKSGRFDAVVTIGQSFILNEQPGVENIQALSLKRKSNQKLTAEETAEFSQQLKQLRSAGQVILNSIVDLEIPHNIDLVYETKQKMATTAIKAGDSIFGRIC